MRCQAVVWLCVLYGTEEGSTSTVITTLPCRIECTKPDDRQGWRAHCDWPGRRLKTMGATYSEFSRTCENYDKQAFTSSRNLRSSASKDSPSTPRAQDVSPFRRGTNWFRGRAESEEGPRPWFPWFKGNRQKERESDAHEEIPLHSTETGTMSGQFSLQSPL